MSVIPDLISSMVAACIELERQLEKNRFNHVIKNIKTEFARNTVVSLSLNEFTKSYATIIVYGLFWTRYLTNHRLTLESAISFFHPFDSQLEFLFKKLLEVYSIEDFQRDGMNRLIAYLNSLDMEKFQLDMKKDLHGENVILHLYERFLATLDPKRRYLRGVFFTPDEIVLFLIRGTDYFLQSHLGIKEGLLNESINILDPAAGVGTFLISIVKYLKNKLDGKTGEDAKNSLLPQSTIKTRFFGFELLLMPYFLSKINFQLILKTLGFSSDSNESEKYSNIYWVNTLSDMFLERTQTEKNAFDIKYLNQIHVIIGNPPYSKYSANKECKWIDQLMRGEISEGARRSSYYEVEGKPLRERKIHLSDDYVKFIRFAQWRIEKTGYGIVSFVTPHGFLTNVSFRGMREQLLIAFDHIYILDLHGNALKGEKTPDGNVDENVFNIKQGVCLIFLIKTKDQAESYSKVFHLDLWGTREAKFQFLSDFQFDSLTWKELNPKSPNFYFNESRNEFRDEYNAFWKITAIYEKYGVGIVTARDKLTLHDSPSSLWKVITEFVDLREEEARRKFNLRNDAESWTVSGAQEDLRACGITKASILSEFENQFIKALNYRPFLKKYTFYTGRSNGFLARPVFHIMRNLINQEAMINSSLVTTRLTKGESFNHAFVTEIPIEQIFLSSKTSNSAYIFPTYILDNEKDTEKKYKPNFTIGFIETLSRIWDIPSNALGNFIQNKFVFESIQCYIYAILNSQSFKQRYNHFLADDFPRIPISSNQSLISILIQLGKELRNLHLIDVYHSNEISERYLKENNINFRIPPQTYIENLGKTKFRNSKLFLNTNSFITGLSPQVMHYKIGGYVILDKWIRDNNKQKFDNNRQVQLKNIIYILHLSNIIVTKIDEIIFKYGGHPIE